MLQKWSNLRDREERTLIPKVDDAATQQQQHAVKQAEGCRHPVSKSGTAVAAVTGGGCAEVSASALLQPYSLRTVATRRSYGSPYGVGEFIVAHSVMPDWTSFFTTVMTCGETCADQYVAANIAHAAATAEVGQSLTSLEVNESRPAVGSSMNSTQGLVISAMPILVRLHCEGGKQWIFEEMPCEALSGMP